MRIGRARLCWWLAVMFISGSLSAQEVRDTIGPLEQQSRTASVENPIPRRTFTVNPAYPAEALAIAATGRVDLVVTLDETGHVAEIRKLPNTTRASARLPATQASLRAAADAFMREAGAALQRWTYDPPARASVRFTVSFAFEPGTESTAEEIAAVPPIRVGSIRGPLLITRVKPIYPAAAQQARVQGVVILEVRVSADGKVTAARVLRGIPLLDQAALDAVRQWEYNPMILSGEFISTIMTATVSFP